MSENLNTTEGTMNTTEATTTEATTTPTPTPAKPARKRKPAKKAPPPAPDKDKGKGKDKSKDKPEAKRSGPGRPPVYDRRVIIAELKRFEGMPGGLNAAFRSLRKTYSSIAKGTCAAIASEEMIRFGRGSLTEEKYAALASVASGGKKPRKPAAKKPAKPEEVTA